MNQPLNSRVLIEAHCAEQARTIADTNQFNLGDGYIQIEHATPERRALYCQMRAWADLADYGVDDYGSDNRQRRWSVAVLAARLHDNASREPAVHTGDTARMHTEIDAGRRHVHHELAVTLRPASSR